MGFTTVDLMTWKRRAHFELFESYPHPWLDVCCDVDMSRPWSACSRDGGPSFAALSLFLALEAVNNVDELRLRIRGDEVVLHDRVNAGFTVLRDDGTFGFAFVESTADFPVFAKRVAAEIERLRPTEGELVDRLDDDVIHFSTVPWLRFTAVGHPRQRGAGDSIPKIVFGRCAQLAQQWTMPVAISAHHGLVDGLHVGHFYRSLQDGGDRTHS